MSRIKDYLQTLNEEGLSSHLSGGDSSGASFDPAVAEESKAPVLTGTDVQETQTQAADDEAETDTAPKAAKAVKSEKKTNGAQGKVVAVDTRVRAVQEMTVVASNKASANKVVPVGKKVVSSEKKVVPVREEAGVVAESQGVQWRR